MKISPNISFQNLTASLEADFEIIWIDSNMIDFLMERISHRKYYQEHKQSVSVFYSEIVDY